MVATACPVLAVGQVVRGVTWSLMMPVALAAVLCGWGVAISQLNGRRAAGWSVALGFPGVFIYVVKLVAPLWKLLLSVYLIIYQAIRWLDNRSLIDPAPFLASWNDLSSRVTVASLRLGEWLISLVKGNPAVDTTAAGLALCLLFWLVGVWAGWHFRRRRLTFLALTPAGVVLTIALTYTREETNLVVLYLIVSLALSGLAHYKDLLTDWLKRGVDYSESIAIDSVTIAAPVVVLVVGLAMLTPSLSWRDLIDKLREPTRSASGQVTDSAKQDAPPNVATNEEYRSGGLPRLILINTPPELLQNVVMTVSTEEEALTTPYYWRTRTYDIYTGVGWASRSARESTLSAGTLLIEPDPAYRTVHQRIELASSQDQSAYWTGILAQADTDLTIAWRLPPPPDSDPLHSGDILGVLASANEYNIFSYIPQVSEAQLQAAGRNYPPEITDRYLDLPDSIPERVLILAGEITGTERTPFDQAVAIESYLRAIPYSLDVDPPPPGQDVVDYFLFTLQKGYCDYYASAMAVMSRAVGLPARIVVGYASGNYNADTKQYVVRQRHAHTWVEIYFPGIGWIEFEPTGSQSSIYRSTNAVETQNDIDQRLVELILPWIREQWQTLLSTLFGQVLLMALGLLGLMVIWQTGSNLYLYMLPSPVTVQKIYIHLEKNALQLLPWLSRGHTPLGLQVSLSKKMAEANTNALARTVLKSAPIEIEKLANLYMEQTYTLHPPSRLQVRSGIKIWSRLIWKLRIVRIFKWIKKESNRS